MRWVIDGFNVLGARPDGWWRDRALALARLRDDLAVWRPDGDEIVVMIDGWPRAEVAERAERAERAEVAERRDRAVEVRYARRPGPDGADRAIVELVAAADDPASITVVTSDAWLRTQVVAMDADVVGAGTFRSRLEACIRS